MPTRCRHPAERILGELRRGVGLREDDSSFAHVAGVAETMTWTRDPFDRVIAAQAVTSGSPLATADHLIRRTLPGHTLWDHVAGSD